MFLYYVLIFLIIAMHNTVQNVGNINNRIITTLNYSKYRVKTTIVNGQAALKGELPYLVSLKATQTKLRNVSDDGGILYVWDSLCGGSIIYPSKVLTAAHCFELENFFLVRHTSAVRVVAGSLQTEAVHTGDTETTASVQWRGVKRIRMHENFNFPLNDIALVIVDSPFFFNDDVSPIRYARTIVDYPEVCRSAGYGHLSNSAKRQYPAPVLMVAAIKTMPRWRCSRIWEMDMSSYVCTESVPSDVAQGDSGGPLACTGTRDPNEEPGKDILLGITCEKGRIIMTLKYAKQRMKPVIVNGTPATRGLVPYIVSIKEPSRTGLFSYTYKNLCGGTIINTHKVLTAAHCFEPNDFAYAKNPSSLRVVAGDLRNIIEGSNMEAQSQWRQINTVIIHPYFNFPLDDIAVIFGNPAWYFTKFVGNIKLARIPTDYQGSCYVAGYGRIGHGKNDERSPVLLVADIDVLPRDQCTEVWEIIMDEFVCSNAVTSDVSIGDSGGPLACKGTPELPSEELLVGVTSGKNYDKTSLFTRVSAYSDWIDECSKGQNLKNMSVFTYLWLCILNIKSTF